jgi:hypothetical protein
MLALGVDAAKNIAIAVVVGFVVLSLVAASAIKNVTYKIVISLLMIGLALGVWTQRSELQDCAQLVRTQAGTTCEFFGTQVDVPLHAPTSTVPG